MSQEVEGHGTLKEVPKLSGKPLELVRPKEIKVPPPPPEDQSISRLVKDVKRGQDEVRKIRKDQEETRRMHAEQLEQQKKLTEIMVQMQSAILAKKVGDSMKTLLASGKTSETSVPGIRRKEVCPSPSFNDVDGDEIVKANMDGDDTPSQSDRNDQGEEEEEIKEDEDSTFGKPASKKIKPPLSPIKMIRKKRRRKLKKIRILLLENLHQRN